MMEALFGDSVLNLIYAAIVLISFLFAVVSLVGAEFGELFSFDLDGDTGFDFISISPFALAAFGAVFGATGLIARLAFEQAALASLIWATGLGLLFAVVAQAFFIYILAPSKSSHVSILNDAVGREAEVVITIPGRGQGRIAYTNVSGRMTLGARSLTGEPIATGDLVVIEKIVGRVALVKPAGYKELAAGSQEA